MKVDSNNIHGGRWNDDPAQQEIFLTAVARTIKRETAYMTGVYGAGMYHEDIESEIQLKLLEQMHKKDTDGPFAKDSPQEAADSILETYKIRELARSPARKEKKRPRRQAEILAKVGPPDLPHDIETDAFAIVKSLPLIASAIPDLTRRDREILFKEGLRQVGIDDLPAHKFDQAAQAVGISSSELRAYIKDHDEDGHSSASDRKAWSRARAKVVKAFTRAKFLSLLVIVFAFALSLGLCIATNPGRSIHQNGFVNKGSLIHQPDLAQGGNLSHQPDLATQGNLIRQNARAHQGG